jgi:chorismate lyase / 3-hydroxybenzoate synthase
MLASFDPTTQSPIPLRVAFTGAPVEPEAIVRIDTPWLAGATCEELFATVQPVGSDQGVQLFRSGGLLLGCGHEPFPAAEAAARTQALYQRILAATRGRHLYRVWNYVPQINAQSAGLENYRAFCQGRSLAFEATLGDEFQPQLPAASAVGCEGPQLKVIFVAGDTAPVHFENPEQVPAYLYPAEHGPRAPSFARATVAREGRHTWTFISGTSAIKGHETVAPGALEAQLECTLDNLRLMSRKAGLGDDLGSTQRAQRQFKVYLRHAGDLAVVRARLMRSLFQPQDVVTYLHAEICRAALNIEIEATIRA